LNASKTISKAYIDNNGNVHVVDGDGIDTKPPKEKGQASSDSIIVADDKQTVGWLAQFPNCCTSYPIALTLVIWRDGAIVHRFGDGLLIADWHFVDGGKQVAFYSNTVHGDFAPHYELRDMKSGRLLGKWHGELTKDAPKWAQEFSD